MERQWWQEKLSIWGRAGIKYVSMVTELLILYCGAHLEESYSKESYISDLFSSYLKKIWSNVWHHHLVNLHVLKTWISLEQKEIFEKSKQHFSSHAVYLFMFENGLDWKDATWKICLEDSQKLYNFIFLIKKRKSLDRILSKNYIVK